MGESFFQEGGCLLLRDVSRLRIENRRPVLFQCPEGGRIQGH